MAKILFCEQFYYPDAWGGTQLLRDVTTHLCRAGHEVAVLCGSDPYVQPAGESGFDPRNAGVRIVRTPRLIPGDIKRLKLLRQLWFYLCAAVILALRPSPDIYVSQTNPPLIVVLVAIIAKLRRRPLMIVAQDLYPEVLVVHAALLESSYLIRLLNMAFGWAYRSACRVVVLGSFMGERVARKGVAPERIAVISNWATGEEAVVRGTQNGLRAQWGLEGKFVLLYSGNVGVGHEFDTLVQAFEKASDSCSSIMLVVIGRGARLRELVSSVSARGLTERVLFKELVPAAQLPLSLGLADLAVVTLRPGFEGLMVPSKALGYMARGIPVLYVGPRSDVSDWIENADGGIAVGTGKVSELADRLIAACRGELDLSGMGARACHYYQVELSAPRGLLRYEQAVRTCLESGAMEKR